MQDPRHSYHPTSMPGRGIHSITTTDHEEAYTMLAASNLKNALQSLMTWETTIIEAIEGAAGHPSILQGVVEAFNKGNDALAGKSVKP